MKLSKFALLSAAACGVCGLAFGQSTAYTAPVGYVSQTCKANSDTIVGLPLRKTANYSGTISVAPDTVTTPGSAILTLSGTPGLTTNAFANTHYVKFADTEPTAAAGDGQWFVISSNTSSSLTVDLNGGTIVAVSGARLEVLKFWTLNELFPPVQSTTDPLTTGNAIVASVGTNPSGLRTQIWIPDFVSAGINLAPAATYFVHGGIWKKFGDGAVDHGADQLWPDSYFFIRNPSSVTSATTYTITGEVEMNSFQLPLSTRIAGPQDNFVATPRGVDVTLNQLNLGGTSSFVTSVGTNPSGLRDVLFTFDNTTATINRSPSATYFYYNSAWRKFGDAGNDAGGNLIPAGSGFIIRKYQTGGGATVLWTNTPSY